MSSSFTKPARSMKMFHFPNPVYLKKEKKRNSKLKRELENGEIETRNISVKIELYEVTKDQKHPYLFRTNK